MSVLSWPWLSAGLRSSSAFALAAGAHCPQLSSSAGRLSTGLSDLLAEPRWYCPRRRAEGLGNTDAGELNLDCRCWTTSS